VQNTVMYTNTESW